MEVEKLVQATFFLQLVLADIPSTTTAMHAYCKFLKPPPSVLQNPAELCHTRGPYLKKLTEVKRALSC